MNEVNNSVSNYEEEEFDILTDAEKAFIDAVTIFNELNMNDTLFNDYE